MNKRRLHLFILIIAVSLGAAGCMRMGPDYERPDIGVASPDSFQHDPMTKSEKTKTPDGSDPDAASSGMPDDWWTVFGDDELNQLVDETLKNNWDIKKATARVMEAGAGFFQSRADRLPSIGLSGEAKKQNQPYRVSVPTINFTPPASFSLGSKTYSEHRETDSVNLSFAASFEIDLWGKLARAEEASRATLLQATEARIIVAQTVVAEVVAKYLEMESLERRTAIAENNIETAKESLTLVEGRYNRGLGDALIVRQARRTLAQAEAALPPLRQDLALAQQQLAVLSGKYPKSSPPRTQPEDYYRALDPVPPGLPSDLLLRRPDVRAAEANLQALNASIGVAKASRFPSISLTGAYGWASDGIGDLIDPKNLFGSIAGGLTAPLFNAGKLKAVQRGAEARYRQGVAEYAKTVLQAFAEVEAALVRRKEQLARREAMVKFVHEARAAQRIAESRYQRGLVSYLNVLETRQARYQAEEALVLVDYALFTNRVSLHRALGGGWADPGPVDIRGPKPKPMKIDPTFPQSVP